MLSGALFVLFVSLFFVFQHKICVEPGIGYPQLGKQLMFEGLFVIFFIHNFTDALGNSGFFFHGSVFHTCTGIGSNPLLILFFCI